MLVERRASVNSSRSGTCCKQSLKGSSTYSKITEAALTAVTTAGNLAE